MVEYYQVMKKDDVCRLFDYSESLGIPYDFSNQLVNYYEVSWDSDRNCTESIDQFGEYCI